MGGGIPAHVHFPKVQVFFLLGNLRPKLKAWGEDLMRSSITTSSHNFADSMSANSKHQRPSRFRGALCICIYSQPPLGTRNMTHLESHNSSKK